MLSKHSFAEVAQTGQRRQLEGLVSKEFVGSNPILRINYPETFLKFSEMKPFKNQIA